MLTSPWGTSLLPCPVLLQLVWSESQYWQAGRHMLGHPTNDQHNAAATPPVCHSSSTVYCRQGLVATASGRTLMQTLFPLCCITLQRPQEEEEAEVDSQSAATAQQHEYEVCIQQVWAPHPTSANP